MKILDDYRELLKHADCHIHTGYTDGAGSVAEYVRQAEKNGLSMIVFSEHVRKITDYDYARFAEEVTEASLTGKIHLFTGCETKVLNTDGELDVSDEILETCQVVTAVFHSFPFDDRQSYLQALHAMLRNPAVDIWGHPLYFARRRGIQLSEEEMRGIIKACIENDVFIEKNTRYDLPDESFIRMAVMMGAKFLIGSDSHEPAELLTLQEMEKVWKQLS